MKFRASRLNYEEFVRDLLFYHNNPKQDVAYDVYKLFHRFLDYSFDEPFNPTRYIENFNVD